MKVQENKSQGIDELNLANQPTNIWPEWLPAFSRVGLLLSWQVVKADYKRQWFDYYQFIWLILVFVLIYWQIHVDASLVLSFFNQASPNSLVTLYEPVWCLVV